MQGSPGTPSLLCSISIGVNGSQEYDIVGPSPPAPAGAWALVCCPALARLLCALLQMQLPAHTAEWSLLPPWPHASTLQVLILVCTGRRPLTTWSG